MPDNRKLCPLGAFFVRQLLPVAAMFHGLSVHAQDTGLATAAVATDSARATATACAVLRSLRQQPSTPYGCGIEGFEETATEYVLQVREIPPPGVLPPSFARSTVRLRKRDLSATVIRVPEL